ncbi:MAG: hypothetical protein ACXW50_22155 [Candidatus Binatia bacterium]
MRSHRARSSQPAQGGMFAGEVAISRTMVKTSLTWLEATCGAAV